MAEVCGKFVSTEDDVESVGGIDVSLGLEVELYATADMSYIKSGEEEIRVYIDRVSKPSIVTFVEEKTEEFDDYLQQEAKQELAVAGQEILGEMRACADEAQESVVLAEEKLTEATQQALIASTQAQEATIQAERARGYFDEMSAEEVLKLSHKAEIVAWMQNTAKSNILDIFNFSVTTTRQSFVAPTNGYLRIWGGSATNANLAIANRYGASIGSGGGGQADVFLPIAKGISAQLFVTSGSATISGSAFFQLLGGG